jgi:Bacterial SH3 domain
MTTKVIRKTDFRRALPKWLVGGFVALVVFLFIVIRANAECIVADPTPTPLNIRTAPNGRIVQTIHNGIQVNVLDHTSDSRGRAWVFVGVGDTPLGWVYRDYVVCKPAKAPAHANPPAPAPAPAPAQAAAPASDGLKCWGLDHHLHPCTQAEHDAQDAEYWAKVDELTAKIESGECPGPYGSDTAEKEARFDVAFAPLFGRTFAQATCN